MGGFPLAVSQTTRGSIRVGEVVRSGGSPHSPAEHVADHAENPGETFVVLGGDRLRVGGGTSPGVFREGGGAGGSHSADLLRRR